MVCSEKTGSGWADGLGFAESRHLLTLNGKSPVEDGQRTAEVSAILGSLAEDCGGLLRESWEAKTRALAVWVRLYSQRPQASGPNTTLPVGFDRNIILGYSVATLKP